MEAFSRARFLVFPLSHSKTDKAKRAEGGPSQECIKSLREPTMYYPARLSDWLSVFPYGGLWANKGLVSFAGSNNEYHDDLHPCVKQRRQSGAELAGWGVWTLACGCEQLVDLLQRTFEVVSTVCFQSHAGERRHAAQFIL